GERRSRASFAEVTLVFDNTAGRLPVDYHEVAIKRRVERDGESDYYLNGTRVRRRDLIHLLASTGLTVDSYAIIDQHDIEHIVVCSPAKRRDAGGPGPAPRQAADAGTAAPSGFRSRAPAPDRRGTSREPTRRRG